VLPIKEEDTNTDAIGEWRIPLRMAEEDGRERKSTELLLTKGSWRIFLLKLGAF
jgi:hypothetical protein